MSTSADIAIIGAGAAGLAAAIFAGEARESSGQDLRIVLLEGARKPGAKILVSGGGRCNVTNERVSAADYSGGPQPLIRNVLRAFDEQRTLAWMREMGVELKLEATSKYFPVTNKARTVLDALLRRTIGTGVELRAGCRVQTIERAPGEVGFVVRVRDGEHIRARRVILATGGLSLPKSGSDGAGLNWARQLGHTIVPTTPALVPLLLGETGEPGVGQFAQLAGLTFPLRFTLQEKSGKRIRALEGSTLFTHFGISGPGPLDISRHLLRERLERPAAGAQLLVGHPGFADTQKAEEWLRTETAVNPRKSPAGLLLSLFPERFARMLAHGLPEQLGALTRPQRLELGRRIAATRLDVTGSRGYSFAETTAGGVDLREVDIRTMESRVVPGLHLCGEMLDVDGRIGGFNFQWAWASGYLAGRGAIQLQET